MKSCHARIQKPREPSFLPFPRHRSNSALHLRWYDVSICTRHFPCTRTYAHAILRLQARTCLFLTYTDGVPPLSMDFVGRTRPTQDSMHFHRSPFLACCMLAAHFPRPLPSRAPVSDSCRVGMSPSTTPPPPPPFGNKSGD